VQEHTPEQIHEANRARKTLRRKLPVKKNRRSPWAAIQDERAAKAPLSSYVQFMINRTASGDFKNIRPTERVKLIGQEWHALSETEKNVSR